jgi:hypothetical protein
MISVLQDINGGAISDYTPIFGGKFMVPTDVDRVLVFYSFGFTHPLAKYKDQNVALRQALALIDRPQEAEQNAKVLEAELDNSLPYGVAEFRNLSTGDVLFTATATSKGELELTPRTDIEYGYYLPPKGEAVVMDKKIVIEPGSQIFIGDLLIGW